jgi:hypothetical protein
MPALEPVITEYEFIGILISRSFNWTAGVMAHDWYIPSSDGQTSNGLSVCTDYTIHWY